MDTNLLSLPRPGTDPQIARVEIDNYKVDPDAISDGEKQNDWQAKLSGSSIELSQWKDDKFEAVTMTPNIENTLAAKIGALAQIRIVGATGKPKSTIKPLRQPSQINDASELDELSSFGFRARKSDDGPVFESANGTVSVATSDGVAVRLLVGSLATKTDNRSLDLNYHTMVMAELDAMAFEKPEQPADVEEDSDENKAWLREVAAIEKKKTVANLRIEGLNRSHSKWIYIVPESVVTSLIPELTLP